MLLVSEDGNAAFWPDFANPAAAEPLTSRIASRVAVLAAGAAGGAAAGGVLAAAGTEDGGVHLLLGGGSASEWVARGRRSCLEP